MADIYPQPGANDTLGILEFFTYVNGATDGLFFAVITLCIWIISLIAMLASGGFNRPSMAKALTFASFISMVLSMPLVVLDLMGRGWMYILILLTGVGALWLILENATE